jgi:serine/threonine protein kinase
VRIATAVPFENADFPDAPPRPGPARRAARGRRSFGSERSRRRGYDARVTADPFGLIGQVLDGQYRVDALAGEGGFSAVYRGTHVGLGEPIAIKCLKLSTALAQVAAAQAARPPTSQAPATPVMNSVLIESFVKRFRDEGRILYKLSQGNLNVVRCIAAGTTTAAGMLVPYLVLEWLEGRSLEADLEARGPGAGRSLAEAMSLLEPAFDAIAYAHAMGVVHRDVSPANLFLAPGRTKVLDFGVAKVMTDDLDIGPRAKTLAQIRIYSPAYAAPEQFDASLGPPSPATDVYSLALVGAEVLAGRPARGAATLGEAMQTALDPAAPRTPRALGASVPDAVEHVFARALSLEPSRRQKDAGELWRELRGAVAAGQGSMDLGATVLEAHELERPPVTARMATAPQPPNLGSLKETVRMSSSAPPPPGPAGPAPPAAPSASQLFQPLAVPPPPGVPVPAATGSLPALKTTERSAGAAAAPVAPAPNDPRLKQTRVPLSAGSTQRAQWLVGLVVFIAVLGVGAVVLRLLLWK